MLDIQVEDSTIMLGSENEISDIPVRDRLIVALDFSTVEEAEELVDELGDTVDFYKIGMGLQLVGGIPYAFKLIEQGKKVFLDFKYFDISETMKMAVRQAAQKGVSFLTIHGDKKIVQAAVEGRGESDLKLLSVSVLTSLDDQDLKDMGINRSVAELVLLRAEYALNAGCDGVVASGLEARAIREKFKKGLMIVTPGIRSEGVSVDDQKRVTTPHDAILGGADYLVVGREITKSDAPKESASKIVSDIAQALSDRIATP